MRKTSLCLAILALAAGSPFAGLPRPAFAQQTTAPEAAGDGPYVTVSGKGWTARSIGANSQPLQSPLPRHASVLVGAVGEVPSFTVPLRSPVQHPAQGEQKLTKSTRLLVVADTHGEYEILVAFLRRQGVIDEKLRWSFGAGQMAVTGDMFDRGAHQLEILWLLYKLEGEARRAGGAVHVLLGNHESMILRGDERYLNPRYKETARILGAPSYGALFDPASVLGNWLRSRPAVLKLGDLLLLHGGISPAIVDAGLSIPDLNTGIRAALPIPTAEKARLDARTALIAGADGPQWYRGYFGEGLKQTPAAEIDRTLSFYGVSRILIGHTEVDKVKPLYGGKVIAVQVYPTRDKVSGAPILEGALRDNGHWFRVTAGGLREAIPISN